MVLWILLYDCMLIEHVSCCTSKKQVIIETDWFVSLGSEKYVELDWHTTW